jgi:hypothetical protein
MSTKTNKPTKILVLTLAVEKNPWLEIERNGQLRTWNSKHSPDTTFLRYSGVIENKLRSKLIQKIWEKLNSNFFARNNIFFKKMFNFLLKAFNSKINKQIPPAEIENNQIVTNAPEGWAFLGIKTISAFKCALETLEFDFLFRINTSSYLNVEKMRESLATVEPRNYYAGLKGIHRGQIFASGCGYILSRDLVELVVDNYKSWNHLQIDDVALGELLTTKFNFPIQEFPRIDVNSIEAVQTITSKDLQNTFLFRCKTGESDSTISIMRELHKKLQNS